MIAIWTTALLLLAAFASAVSLTWRRYAVQPVRVNAAIEGPTCYPHIKR